MGAQWKGGARFTRSSCSVRASGSQPPGLTVGGQDEQKRGNTASPCRRTPRCSPVPECLRPSSQPTPMADGGPGLAGKPGFFKTSDLAACQATVIPSAMTTYCIIAIGCHNECRPGRKHLYGSAS